MRREVLRSILLARIGLLVLVGGRKRARELLSALPPSTLWPGNRQ